MIEEIKSQLPVFINFEGGSVELPEFMLIEIAEKIKNKLLEKYTFIEKSGKFEQSNHEINC